MKTQRLMPLALLTSLLFFWLAPLSGFSQNAADYPYSTPDAASPVPHQITFGYWNDNLIFEFLDKFMKDGNDNYVTASFWSQIDFEKINRWWMIDIYYNILTNKTDNYRFDLLALKLSVEKDTRRALLQAGTGIIARGNFGGSGLQTGFHEIFGFTKVELPYSGANRTGLMLSVKVEPYIRRGEYLTLSSYLSSSFRTAAAPSNYRIGLNTICKLNKNNPNFSLEAQARAGYIRYYRRGDLLEPLFDRGVSYGIMFVANIFQTKHFAIWMTDNQYGRHQPHYGISFTFGSKQQRALRLSDITFP